MPSGTSPDSRSARLFRISGRVQGVFFRASTRDFAGELGLTGYAFNLPDGRVEVFACGGSAELDQLATWLEEGPPLASVSAVECESVAPEDRQGFVIG